MDQYAKAACEGKRSFDSYSKAKRSLRHNEKNRSVYRCQACGKFHVGSRLGKKQRKPRLEQWEKPEQWLTSL